MAYWSPDGELAVRLQPGNPRQQAEIGLYQGMYERAEREVVERVVAPGNLCIDVGASFGIYSLLLASLVGPTGRVVACEPSPPALTRLNQATKDISWVEVRPVAVGARRHESSLLVAPGDSMHSSLREVRPPGGEPHRVQIFPLADLTSPGGEIAFVKVDVEGFEAHVVAGMEPLLAAKRVRYAMFEAEPSYGKLSWVDELQDTTGYTTYRLGVVARGLRWKPTLTPLRAGDAVAGTLFVVRDDRKANLTSL